LAFELRFRSLEFTNTITITPMDRGAFSCLSLYVLIIIFLVLPFNLLHYFLWHACVIGNESFNSNLIYFLLCLLLNLNCLKPVLLTIASLVIFSSDAIQMSLECMLLLYTIYYTCACQMQINSTYLLTYYCSSFSFTAFYITFLASRF